MATEQAVSRRFHARIAVEMWRRTSRQIRSCWPVVELSTDILYGQRGPGGRRSSPALASWPAALCPPPPMASPMWCLSRHRSPRLPSCLLSRLSAAAWPSRRHSSPFLGVAPFPSPFSAAATLVSGCSCLPPPPLRRLRVPPQWSHALVPFGSAPPQAGAAAHQSATRVCRFGHWHWGGVRLGCQKQLNPPLLALAFRSRRLRHRLLSQSRRQMLRGAQVVVAAPQPRPTFLTPPSNRALPHPRLLPVPLMCLFQPLLLPPSPGLAQSAAAKPRHRLKAAHRRRRPQLLLPVTRSLQTRPPL